MDSGTRIRGVSAPRRWDGTSPSGGGGGRLRDARLDGVRILIVDDDPDGRELLMTVLEQRGASVVAASCAADAFALLARRPDVLVSDIAMPEEDGLTLIRRIRTLPADEGGAVPAIAVTAYAARSDRARALEAGFDCYLSKPVDLEALIATIDELRARRRDAG
jgi:CheY-like chemotaxis protein